MAQIVLIDDDHNVLQMVTLMLQRFGHEVETSDNGQEGLNLIAKLQPDLAIIDVMMPVLNGYDVVRMLRENPGTSRIPIMILTARSQPMDKHRALEAGANTFLSKPVTAQELNERVDAVLRVGVDYHVHTGLLTEPIQRKSASPEAPAQAAPAPAPELSSTPKAPIRPLERRPIGAEDIARPPEPEAEVPKGQLPVTTVISLRGGVGTTTIALNLAFVLGARDQRVCLVDLSQAGGHIPLHLHIPCTQSWGQLIGTGDNPDPRLLRQLLTRHEESGVMVLCAPPVPSPRALSSEATHIILSRLGGAFNHTVVDAPGLDTASLGALELSRAVIVVMSDDPASVQTTTQFLAALPGLGVEAGRVRVVLNHIRPIGDITAETIQKALKRPISAEIPYDHNVVQSIRRGSPLVVAQPNGQFALAIQGLARTITA